MIKSSAKICGLHLLQQPSQNYSRFHLFEPQSFVGQHSGATLPHDLIT
ncbi:hypothetical protein H1Q63_01850 [Desmonostoc muscorum CCALA 125]|nr:hypothetical protein [Desmonostoc muscorum CCALA 125]